MELLDQLEAENPEDPGLAPKVPSVLHPVTLSAALQLCHAATRCLPRPDP